MVKGLDFQKINLMKLVLKHVVNASRKDSKSSVVQSEPEASSSKAKIISKPKNSKPKVMINSDFETSKIKILKRSEPVP